MLCFMLRVFVLLGLLFVVPNLACSEDAYYIGPRVGVDMLKSPHLHAKVIHHLPRLMDVSVITKRRSWWKIKVMVDNISMQGWVPQGAIRKRYQAKSKAASSAMTSFFNLFRRAPSKRETAVLGVRGLDNEAKLSKANQASVEAVRWMEKLQVSDQAVSDFIQAGDLNP